MALEVTIRRYCERWPPKWREPAMLCRGVVVAARGESFGKCTVCGGRVVYSVHHEAGR
jgi:hypothetical protein